MNDDIQQGCQCKTPAPFRRSDGPWLCGQCGSPLPDSHSSLATIEDAVAIMRRAESLQDVREFVVEFGPPAFEHPSPPRARSYRRWDFANGVTLSVTESSDGRVAFRVYL